MALGVIDRPVTAESILAASLPDVRRDSRSVLLAEARRKARRHVRLYQDKAGVYYVRDRLHGRRDIVAIRFLTIDGKPLNCGAAVLAPV